MSCWGYYMYLDGGHWWKALIGRLAALWEFLLFSMGRRREKVRLNMFSQYVIDYTFILLAVAKNWCIWVSLCGSIPSLVIFLEQCKVLLRVSYSLHSLLRNNIARGQTIQQSALHTSTMILFLWNLNYWRPNLHSWINKYVCEVYWQESERRAARWDNARWDKRSVNRCTVEVSILW